MFIVEASGKGRVSLNGESLSNEQLRARIAEIMATRAEKLVYVRANNELTFQDLADTLASLDDTVDHVALLTPAVERQDGCLGIRLPPATDYAFEKPLVEMKTRPWWRIW
jgi:hypothetical protein